MLVKRMIIAVDLDKTLAFYKSGYYLTFGPLYIGDPIPKMVARVKKWLREGITVRIYTARVAEAPENHTLDEVIRAIENWCLLHIGEILEITCTKTPDIDEFWDDKGIGIIENTGERADGKED